ncbi:sensor histidine kinase [Syntrophomonas curvata]
MYQTPLMLLVTGFVTGFLSPLIGLLLVNIKPNLLRLIIVASFYGIANLIVRSFPIPFGTHFVILTVVLYIMIMVSWKLSFFRALIPTVIGTLVLVLGETICVSMVIKILKINMLDLLQDWMCLWSLIPQVILILLVAAIINCFNLHVFDFIVVNPYGFDNVNNTRSNLVSILTGVMLILLIFQFLLNFSILYALPSNFLGIEIEDAGILSSSLMVIIFLMIIIVINQLLALSRKENEYLVQLAYLNTLDELYTAIRAEGHDRINHLQTLYGFVQLGNLNETRKYLEELMGDTIISQHHAVQGNPGLSALFYIKSGIAASQGIQFNLEIRSEVAQIAVPSYELSRIIGNLINNAFDAVADLERGDRWVNVSIYEQGADYVFKVSNHGNIDQQTAKNAFSRGYTTKQGGHSGMGLYIIRLLIEKYQGKIVLETAQNVVEFTAVLPKSKREWELDALSGPKTGPELKGELRADG